MARQHELHDLLNLFRRGRVHLDGKQLSRNPDGGMVVGLNVDVGGAHVDGELEQAVKIFHELARDRYGGATYGRSGSEFRLRTFRQVKKQQGYFEASGLRPPRAIDK